FGPDYLGFLATCGLEVTITPYGEQHWERVSELAQRTNQLNFSGHKYSHADLLARLADPGLEKHVLDCRDKFGSYGTVGFALVSRQPEEVFVQEFMLSCRVQGKFVEQIFFHFLTARGESRLLVNFHTTQRNQAARQTLAALHFTFEAEQVWLDTRQHSLACPFIRLYAPGHFQPDAANGADGL
ncbi:MAG: FkbH domain-containing protein, partial [Magnetococcales bacterium]|nr:FkbH domain-containing protein [Magnetococcales bacterium]NGZ29306.1 FkbH domain-containing protein [Magnetococcales bacterium]